MKRVLFARASTGFDKPGRALYALVRCLDRSQDEPHIAVPAGGELADRFRDLGVPVHEVPLNRARNAKEIHWQSDWVGRAPWRERQLGVLMESLRPEIIHLDGVLGVADTLAARRYADRHDTLMVWHLLEFDRLRRPSQQLVFNEVLRKNDLVVASSRAPAHWLPSRAQLVVIPDGCDLTGFTARRDGNDDESRLVGWVGRLPAESGLSELFEAFPRIVERKSDARLLVCALPGADGVASLREPREMAVRCAPGLVEWHPPTDRRGDIYSRLGVFLELGLDEVDLDECAVEAQASGVPIVGYRGTALEGLVVDGQTGFLVEPGDRRAAAEAALELLRDEPLRREFGAVASRHARAAFAAESTANRVQRLYEAGLAAR